MFKTITLLKRRPGLTMDELIAGYETIHSKIGERVLGNFAKRYIRRYLHPLSSTRPAAARAPDADIVMEVWYADRDAYERAMANILPHRHEVSTDELRWFDPDSIRTFEVEEHESGLPGGLTMPIRP